MPQDGPKSSGTQGLHAFHQTFEGRAVALPFPGFEPADVVGQRGRVRETRPFRKPLADAGGANAAGDEADRNAQPLGQRVAEGGQETATVSAGSGLRIVGGPPAGAIKGAHPARLG